MNNIKYTVIKIRCPLHHYPNAGIISKKRKDSLCQPKKDQCDICTAHTAGNVNDDMYNNHIKAKEDARAEKMKDNKSLADNDDLVLLYIDVQKVLLAPQSKAIQFITRKHKRRNVTCGLSVMEI